MYNVCNRVPNSHDFTGETYTEMKMKYTTKRILEITVEKKIAGIKKKKYSQKFSTKF